ncbi:hypothetical protein BJ684DRAFT_19129 [Piptocephalis cylindrospora]|uniref:Uncharacterized protein n=1 Tax=Piptocephalis cylindrospora TaxID=1907219 RepID=A0A4P9Y631_9FUNG|nr:hypothetical protein BJ684DRAFT_19129 [Piptocephalis cylindrospora]|eukprot:RKP14467.1 hypothetical protein BJ684DRAFT_19129 [Piptocephalis cylindrospora]
MASTGQGKRSLKDSILSFKDRQGTSSSGPIGGRRASPVVATKTFPPAHSTSVSPTEGERTPAMFPETPVPIPAPISTQTRPTSLPGHSLPSLLSFAKNPALALSSASFHISPHPQPKPATSSPSLIPLTRENLHSHTLMTNPDKEAFHRQRFAAWLDALRNQPPGPPEGAYTGEHIRLPHSLREKRSSRLGGGDAGTSRDTDEDQYHRSQHLPSSSPSSPPQRPGRLRRHHTISNGSSHFKALQDLWRELARNADRSIPRQRGKKKGGRRALPLPMGPDGSLVEGESGKERRRKKQKKQEKKKGILGKKREKRKKGSKERESVPPTQASVKSGDPISSTHALWKGKKGQMASPSAIAAKTTSPSSSPSASSISLASSTSHSSSTSSPSTGVETTAADIDTKHPGSLRDSPKGDDEDDLLNPLRSPPAPAFAMAPHTDGPPTDGVPSVTGLSFDPDDVDEDDEDDVEGVPCPHPVVHTSTSSSATSSSPRKAHRTERRNSAIVNEVSALFRRQRQRSSKGLKAFAKRINEALKRHPSPSSSSSSSSPNRGHRRSRSTTSPPPVHTSPVRSRPSLSSDPQPSSYFSVSPKIESPSSSPPQPPLTTRIYGKKDSPAASGTEDGSEIQMWGRFN